MSHKNVTFSASSGGTAAGVFVFLLSALVFGSVLRNAGAGVVIGFLCFFIWKLEKRVSRLEAKTNVANPTFDEKPLFASETSQKNVEEITSEPGIQPLKPITPIFMQPSSILNQDKSSPPRFKPKEIEPTVKFKKSDVESIDDIFISYFKEFFAQGNPFAKIGALILFFGVAFALKFAADEGFFSPQLRLILATGLSIVLSVFGWRMRRTNSQFSKILLGASYGILYITTFIAFKMYHFMPASMAFLFFCGTTILCVYFSIILNSKAVALLAVTGGFLAPVLSSSGGGNHISLFSYVAILDVAIIVISVYRSWNILNLTGFCFTFLICNGWALKYYKPEFYLSCQIFLAFFGILYTFVNVIFNIKAANDTYQKVSNSLLTFALPLLYALVQWKLVTDFSYGTAISSASLGVFYITVAQIIFRKYSEKLRDLTEYYLTFGFGFLTLTIPFLFDNRVSSAIWALEGTALIWSGIRQNRFVIRIFGMILIFVASILFLTNLSYLKNSFFDRDLLGFVLLTVSNLISASLIIHTTNENVRASEKRIALVGLICAILWATLGGITKISTNLPEWRMWCFELIPSNVWVSRRSFDSSVYQIFSSVTLFGFWVVFKNFMLPGRKILKNLLLPVHFLVVCLYFIPILFKLLDTDEHVFAILGVFSIPLFFVIHYYVQYFEEKVLDGRREEIIHQSLFLYFILLVTWEISWLANRFGNEDWCNSVLSFVPMVICLYVIYRLKNVKSWPLSDYSEAYSKALEIPLIWAVLASFIINFRSQSTAPLPYVPLLNALDIAQVFTAITSILYVRSQEDKSLKFERQKVFAFFSGWIFIWFTVTLLRIMHHYFSIPWKISSFMSSNETQAALSIFWGLISLILMFISRSNNSREIWKVGALLISVVVLKLFFIDLSNHATIGRIAAFLGVGGLMLGIGYLAPIPPANTLKKEDGGE